MTASIFTPSPSHTRHWLLEGKPRSLAISTAAVLAFLLLWEIAPTLGWVNGRFTSQPSHVVFAALEVFATDNFLFHAQISLTELFFGFVLALVIGIPAGILLGNSRLARDIVNPPMMALYIAPNIVLLPILTIWLGIGMGSKVAVVFLGGVFPIIVNTMAGIREVNPHLIRVARSFGATSFDIFHHILLPGSLPALLAGVRLAVGRAVLSVIVGELYASQAGIGHMLARYGSAMRIDRLLVYALVISAFGYAMTTLVRLVEGRVRNWKD